MNETVYQRARRQLKEARQRIAELERQLQERCKDLRKLRYELRIKSGFDCQESELSFDGDEVSDE